MGGTVQLSQKQDQKDIFSRAESSSQNNYQQVGGSIT